MRLNLFEENTADRERSRRRCLTCRSDLNNLSTLRNTTFCVRGNDGISSCGADVGKSSGNRNGCGAVKVRGTSNIARKRNCSCRSQPCCRSSGRRARGRSGRICAFSMRSFFYSCAVRFKNIRDSMTVDIRCNVRGVRCIRRRPSRRCGISGRCMVCFVSGICRGSMPCVRGVIGSRSTSYLLRTSDNRSDVVGVLLTFATFVSRARRFAESKARVELRIGRTAPAIRSVRRKVNVDFSFFGRDLILMCRIGIELSVIVISFDNVVNIGRELRRRNFPVCTEGRNAVVRAFLRDRNIRRT